MEDDNALNDSSEQPIERNLWTIWLLLASLVSIGLALYVFEFYIFLMLPVASLFVILPVLSILAVGFCISGIIVGFWERKLNKTRALYGISANFLLLSIYVVLALNIMVGIITWSFRD